MSPIRSSDPFSIRDAGMTPIALATMANRYWKRFVLTFLATVALVFTTCAFCPRVYRSEAKLLVRLRPVSNGLDQRVPLGKIAAVPESTEAEINSIVQLMSSRSVAERVVKSLGPDFILKQSRERLEANFRIPFEWALSTMRHLMRLQAETDFELAVQVMHKRLSQLREPRSHVITVAYEDSTAERAQKIISAWIDAYLKQHAAMDPTSESRQFFQQQIKELVTQIDVASRRLSKAKNRMGVADVNARRRIVEQQLGAIETELRSVRAQLSAAESRRAQLESPTASMSYRQESDVATRVANDASALLRQQLYDLQMKHRELQTVYDEGHPAMKKLVAQLDAAQTDYDRRQRERSSDTISSIPFRAAVELDVVRATADVASLQAKLSEILTGQDALKKTLIQLNQDADDLSKHQRAVDVLIRNHSLHVEKFAESQIAHESERGRLPALSVAEGPSFSTTPSWPNVTAVIVSSLLSGLILGFTVASVSEMWRRRFITAHELESALGIPVLATVPRAKLRDALIHESEAWLSRTTTPMSQASELALRSAIIPVPTDRLH